MASRLIERLDDAIAREANPYFRECLKAERVAALARQGLLDEARFALKGLQTQSRRYRKPLLQGWVHYVDGLVDHFDSMSRGARDKFVSARAQAELAGNQRLRGLSSAWIANCDFNLRRYDDMHDALLLAVGCATADDHGTLARAMLVRADASRYAGLGDALVAPLYTKVHQHCVADGDTAMISAMLHNRALLQTTLLVLDEVFGAPRQEEQLRTLKELESTGNLDRGLGNDALNFKVPLLRAELCVTLQRWGEAVELFNAHVDQLGTQCAKRLTATYLAHRAWSLWQLGACHKALDDAEQAASMIRQDADFDDQAIAHGRLAMLFDAAGADERGRTHRRLAQTALASFREDQAKLVLALQRVSTSLGG